MGSIFGVGISVFTWGVREGNGVREREWYLDIRVERRRENKKKG